MIFIHGFGISDGVLVVCNVTSPKKKNIFCDSREY
jgi:hypothetical protein